MKKVSRTASLDGIVSIDIRHSSDKVGVLKEVSQRKMSGSRRDKNKGRKVNHCWLQTTLIIIIYNMASFTCWCWLRPQSTAMVCCGAHTSQIHSESVSTTECLLRLSQPVLPCGFFFFLLCWVFIAARRLLSLVVASRGYSLLQCTDFSFWWLLLWSTGSRVHGLQ